MRSIPWGRCGRMSVWLAEACDDPAAFLLVQRVSGMPCETARDGGVAVAIRFVPAEEAGDDCE